MLNTPPMNNSALKTEKKKNIARLTLEGRGRAVGMLVSENSISQV